MSEVFEKGSIFERFDGYAVQFGNVAHVYMQFVTQQEFSGIDTILKILRPKAYYTIIPIFLDDSPYLQTGSLWLNHNGKITGYGLQPNTRYYICSTWIAE